MKCAAKSFSGDEEESGSGSGSGSGALLMNGHPVGKQGVVPALPVPGGVAKGPVGVVPVLQVPQPGKYSVYVPPGGAYVYPGGGQRGAQINVNVNHQQVPAKVPARPQQPVVAQQPGGKGPGEETSMPPNSGKIIEILKTKTKEVL